MLPSPEKADMKIDLSKLPDNPEIELVKPVINTKHDLYDYGK